jgi:CubicO group peptidase (beta-lactamase class C family)
MQQTRIQFLGGLSGAALACGARGLFPSRAVAAGDPTAAIQRIADEYVASNVAAGRAFTGVVIGIVAPNAPGAKLFFAGKLVAPDDHTRPMMLDGDTPFEIGSITKVFCSTVFGKSAGSYGGLLGDYVKLALPQRVANLPIQAIVNYSSGFPSDAEPPVWYAHSIDATTLPGLIRTMSGKALPQCVPGTAYSYSNFAWGLLGLAALRASDLKADLVEEWMHEIGRLGMQLGLSAKTGPRMRGTRPPGPAAYAKDGTLISARSRYAWPEWPTLFGAADLLSTGNDMHKWLAYNMGIGGADYPLLRAQQSPSWIWTETVPAASGGDVCPALTHNPYPLNAAIGWFRTRWENDVAILSKNGGVNGFSSWMGFVQWAESGTPSPLGAFVLTNNRVHVADAVGELVTRTLVANNS